MPCMVQGNSTAHGFERCNDGDRCDCGALVYRGGEPVPTKRVYELTIGGARVLTPDEEASREVNAYVEEIRRLRRAVRAAHRILLKHEHVSANLGYPLEALTILSEALGE